MPHHCPTPPQNALSGGRSGAENPIVKGTPPQRATPITHLSPHMDGAHPPLDLSNTNQQAPVQEQVTSNNICYYYLLALVTLNAFDTWR